MKTLKSSINLKGTGLMSGVEFEVEIKPAAQKGIYFQFEDKTVQGVLHNVVSSDHCVVVANVAQGADFKVALIEHFMAACAICSIDGIIMEFKNPGFSVPMFEVPILDGSSKVWVEKFNETGYMGEEETYPVLKNTVAFQKDRSAVVLMPNDVTKISYMVNFNHPTLKNRWAELNLDKNLDEITEARTFGYLKDLETFQKMGLSKGVTIDNTVGMKDDGTFTTELRSEFEPNKHKILDIIGDLYLTGVNPLKMNANIIVKEAGHALHIEAAKMLKDSF